MDWSKHNKMHLEEIATRFITDIDKSNMLVNLYTEKHRAYHGAHHIVDLVDHIHPSFIENSREHKLLVTTILYHDAVYYPASKYNEELSAMLYSEHASEEEFSVEVYNAIYASKQHTHPDNSLLFKWTRHFLDLDLAGLASDNNKYLENTRNIYKEFSSTVKLAEFVEGRKKFITSMLESKQIFWLPELLITTDAEAKARENMRYELELLPSDKFIRIIT